MSFRLMKVLVGAAVIAFLVAVTGCEEEGPAEEAGKQIDETAEEIDEELEEAGEDIEEAVEDDDSDG